MYRGVLKVGALALVAVLLVGLFLSAAVRWRERAGRARCQWHLHEVGLKAMWSYAEPDVAQGVRPDDVVGRMARVGALAPSDARVFPPGTVSHATLPPDRRLSWHVTLLPHLGRDDVVRRFDLTAGWQAEANAGGAAALVKEYVCPTQYRPAAPGELPVTHYVGLAGVGADAPRLRQDHPRAGFLRHDDATKHTSIQRGLSNTIMVLETSTDLGPWAAGGPATVRGLDRSAAPYVGPGRPFGGHVGGAHAAFADGSVRFQAAAIGPRVLELMATLGPALDEESP